MGFAAIHVLKLANTCVIVVGAGTAGCHLTKKLVQNGLDVCLLEPNKRTKEDSGIVSRHFFDYVKDKRLIKSRVKAMDLISTNSRIEIRSTGPFAYILKRRQLGRTMRRSVKSKIVAESFVACEAHKGWVEVKTSYPGGGPHSYGCRVLVGADGSMSTVRKALGIEQPEMSWGLFGTTKSKQPRNISVHFNKRYSSDGFAWQIPQNSEVGLLSENRLMERFQTFVRDAKASVKHPIGHPIPIGYCRSYADRALLVGDAASQVKPITGGGIVWGIECAEVAAKAIMYAFDANRFDSFFWKTEYEKRWKNLIGKEKDRQILARKVYTKLTDLQVDRLLGAVKSKLEHATSGEFDYDAISKLIGARDKLMLTGAVLGSMLPLA